MAKKTRVSRTRNGGTMTEAQYWGKLRSTLRRAFMFWVPMKMALDRVKRPSLSTNKRLKWEYQCEKCHSWHPRKDVEVDHTIPCGTLLSLEDIGPFIANLTQENPSAYQILCKTCHKSKTLNERKQRVAHGNRQ